MAPDAIAPAKPSAASNAVGRRRTELIIGGILREKETSFNAHCGNSRQWVYPQTGAESRRAVWLSSDCRDRLADAAQIPSIKGRNADATRADRVDPKLIP